MWSEKRINKHSIMETKEKPVFSFLRQVVKTTGKYARYDPKEFRLTIGEKSTGPTKPFKLIIRWPLGGVWTLTISRLPIPGTDLHIAHTPPDKDHDTVMYAIKAEQDQVTLITLEDPESCLVMIRGNESEL